MLEGEEMDADLAHAANRRELDDRETFDLFPQREACKFQKQIARTRRVLTRRTVDGRKCVRVRLAAKGFQGPDLKEGLLDSSGCARPRSSHLQAIPPGAIRKWNL